MLSFIFVSSVVFFRGVNLEERVGAALSGIQVILLGGNGGEPKTGQFGVVGYEKFVLDLAIFVKNRDETVFASLGKVVTSNVQESIGFHGEGSGSETSRELMEDAGVEHSRRVDYNTEDAVLKRFSNVKDGLFIVHGETGGVGKAAVDDRLEHGNTKVNYEETAGGVLERALTKRTRVGEEKRVVLFGEEHGVGSLKSTSIKILDNRDDFNSVISHSLG